MSMYCLRTASRSKRSAKKTTIADSVEHIRSLTELAVITLDKEGSMIVTPDNVIEIKPVGTTVVDTTGAGDAYAAGFLHGWTRGLPLKECGDIASATAGEVVSHVGARRQKTQR